MRLGPAASRLARIALAGGGTFPLRRIGREKLWIEAGVERSLRARASALEAHGARP